MLGRCRGGDDRSIGTPAFRLPSPPAAAGRPLSHDVFAPSSDLTAPRAATLRPEASGVHAAGLTPSPDAIAELRQAAARLELAADLADLGVWSIDLVANSATQDERLARILGLTAEELASRPLLESWGALVPAEEIASVNEAVARAVAAGPGEGSRYRVEHRVVRPDGRTGWLAVIGQVVHDAEGRPIRIVGVARDVTQERASTEELRRWADLVEHTTHGVSITDVRTGAFEIVNPALARMLGYTTDEMRGLPVRTIYPDELREQMLAYQRQASDRGAVDFDTVLRRKDGSTVAARVQLTTVRDVDGTPLYRIANCHDIRHLGRLEMQQRFLAEAGARFSRSLDARATVRELMRLAVPALADWAAFNVRTDGSAFLHTLEIQHADPSKVSLAHELERRWPMRADAAEGVAKALRTREPELVPLIPDSILEAVAHDAEHLALLRGVGFRSLMNVPLVVRGHAYGVLSFARSETASPFDADDLAFAQELAQRAALAIDNAELFAAERRARTFAERLQGVTSAFSEAMTRQQVTAVLLGQGLEVLGASGGAVMLRSADGATLELLASVGDDARTVEVPLVLAGRTIGVLTLSFPSRREFPADERDFITALAQQGAQALERARLFEAERAARSEAEAANRAKSEFLATMSHELRTPINAALGHGELLAMEIHGGLTDAQRDALARIQRSQHRLLALVNDVLSFARLDAGQIRVEITDVPIAEVVADVETLMQTQVESRGLVLDTHGATGDCVARGDRDRVEQILLNLLSNACKFTPSGGRVVLACRTEGDVVAVTVRDTGRGIPREKLETVFEPFVQVESGLTRRNEGTGLGLAISRTLARAMGGELTLESELGAGSTFELRLPRVHQELPAPGHPG